MIYTTVCAISFSKIEHITHYQQIGKDEVSISSSAWQQIDFVKGSASLAINESSTDPGRLRTVNLFATLHDDFKTGKGITLVTLTDGSTIAIGTIDIPVDMTKSVATYKTAIALSYNFHSELLKATIIA